MNKIKKIALIAFAGFSFMTITSCTSTDIFNDLVDAEIITLPSINLDFRRNDKIEITEKLLNSWEAKLPSKSTIIDDLRERIDIGGAAKSYLSKKIPTDDSYYFPVNVEELGTLYVITEALSSY